VLLVVAAHVSILALPEGGQLELTAGPAAPSPGTDEDLLVVYIDGLEAVAAIGSALQVAGVRRIDAANPCVPLRDRVWLDRQL